uniref:Uncharacterized protein n=1 Tax=Arundo donax TaxID=35708 RepID=A0A0A9H0F0_ARUDO
MWWRGTGDQSAGGRVVKLGGRRRCRSSL